MATAANVLLGRARSLLLVRLQLAASASVVLGGVLAGILFLAALFSRQAVLGRAAVAFLSLSVLGQAVSQPLALWWLWRSGSWRGLGGERISRDQKPRWFRFWLTAHAALAIIYLTAGGFLTWITFKEF